MHGGRQFGEITVRLVEPIDLLVFDLGTVASQLGFQFGKLNVAVDLSGNPRAFV